MGDIAEKFQSGHVISVDHWTIGKMALMTKLQDVAEKCCNAGERQTPQHRSHFVIPLSGKLDGFLSTKAKLLGVKVL